MKRFRGELNLAAPFPMERAARRRPGIGAPAWGGYPVAMSAPQPLGPSLRQRIERHLADFERRTIPLEGRLHAAVGLTLLADEEGRPSFVLTRRAAGLRRHAGQWALPGGRIDPGETAAQAALRELEE